MYGFALSLYERNKALLLWFRNNKPANVSVSIILISILKNRNSFSYDVLYRLIWPHLCKTIYILHVTISIQKLMKLLKLLLFYILYM
jgi:hypothetical protein